jgi:hypothetical protein
MEQAKPIHEIKLRDVSVEIHRRKTQDGEPWFSVRCFRHFQGDPGKGFSFRRDDVPMLCKALESAYVWILRNEQSSGSSMSRSNGAGSRDVLGRAGRTA